MTWEEYCIVTGIQPEALTPEQRAVWQEHWQAACAETEKPVAKSEKHAVAPEERAATRTEEES